VNQRALIDKVLARYSGEFTGQSCFLQSLLSGPSEQLSLLNTVFRELLQNSDDAGSRSVEIRFETKMHASREKGVNSQSNKLEQGLPDLKTAVVCDFSFRPIGMF
jgi:hypothetical protein